MNKFQGFSKFLNNFLEVPTTDPDDARQRRLLNIILTLVAIIGLLVAITTIIASITGAMERADTLNVLPVSVGMLLVSVVIYLINRYRSGVVASTLFLLLLMAGISFADTFEELASGRSLFLFIIPIIIASVLLGSRSVFIFYILTSIEILIIATLAGMQIIQPSISIITFLFVSFITWLSARSLEQALRELRQINTNLDQIVQERTHALAEALTRERIEAGRSQAILESIADGVLVFDTHGNAIQANPALSNLINMPLNDIVKTTVNDLVEASPMNAKNRGALAGLLTKPGTKPINYRVEWGQKTISVSSGQVFDRDGSQVGTVAVFRDFTKEAELEKMKSAFVAMVSHELRTPLSAILGYAEIFKEQIYGPLNERQMTTTERVISNSRRLLNLINDLLDQAQMEAGKLKIKYEKIKPASLLENLHSVMEKLTSDKGLALTSELDENMPETLVGDSARLQQILVNLVNNAAKFTEEGSIHVKLSRLNNSQWEINVTDTGAGIPKKELPHIFDTFRQVEGTTTRVHGGFGLGLSIVKQLVQLMGGNVSVESELGKGSSFIITLPIDAKSMEVT